MGILGFRTDGSGGCGWGWRTGLGVFQGVLLEIFVESGGVRRGAAGHAIEGESEACEDGGWHAQHEEDAEHVRAGTQAVGFVGIFAAGAGHGGGVDSRGERDGDGEQQGFKEPQHDRLRGGNF